MGGLQVVKTIVVISVALAVASCAFVNKVDPPISQTPQPGYACGLAEHTCEIVLEDGGVQALGTCCGNDEVCGGGRFNGCPAGYCCPDSNDYPDPEIGRRPPRANRPQWAATPLH